MAENIKSILAVDDANINLQIIYGLLRNDYKLHLAKSGKIALNVLKRITPDLILLDIEMPEMNGFNVMDEISRIDRIKNIPVILVTAHSSKEYVLTAGRHGVKDYIVKPFDPELLQTKIINNLKESKPSKSEKKIYTSQASAFNDYDLENNLNLLYMNNLKKTSGLHMKIISDLFDYYKIESGKSDLISTYFDLNEFFSGIVWWNRNVAEAKGLIFQSDFDHSLPHIIFGDEIRMNQIIAGILSNVIQYTRQGYVRLSAVHLIEDGEENVTLSVESSELSILEPDFMKIYEKFEQSEIQKNNTSTIKLPIARQLADMIGGEIYFTNTRDKGSAFTVKLPLQSNGNDELKSKMASKPVMAKSNVKVLVVDDNPVNLRIAVAMLYKHGIITETAQSGEEALKKIQIEQFDLIFMDHLMHGMDGAEATKAIRALGGEYYGEVPIIALSAYTAAKARDLFLRSGMNDFITKPIDEAELNMALKNWLPAGKLIDGRFDSEESDVDESKLNELLNRISTAGSQELSIVRGLKSVGGDKKLYIEILTQFCNWIENDMRLVTEAVIHKRWKDYAIRMHALKTVFANIGDQLMSDWAYSLEKAAAEGNTEKCVKETEHFHNNVAKLHSRLADIFDAEPSEEQGNKNSISTDKLTEILRQLSEACLTCYAGHAEDLSMELQKWVFDLEMDDNISQICGFITSFDFDKAYETIQTVLEKLYINV